MSPINGRSRGAPDSSSRISLPAPTAHCPIAAPYCGTGILGVTNVSGGYSVNSHIFKLDTSYKVNESLNVYADYSEGFRRGGANAIPLAGPFEVSSALLVYKPDKTKNYEIGAKGTLPGGINYTADVFFIDWNDFQLDTSSYYGGYPLSANGSKAHSKGVELSFDGKLGSHFSYALGYAYTKAQVAQSFQILDRLDDGTNNLAGIVSAQSGDPLPNAPENSATWALNYTHAAPEFMRDWSARLHIDGSYRSSTYSRLLNNLPRRAGALLDQRLRPVERIGGSDERSRTRPESLRSKPLQPAGHHRRPRSRRGRPAADECARGGITSSPRPRTIGLHLSYKLGGHR